MTKFREKNPVDAQQWLPNSLAEVANMVKFLGQNNVKFTLSNNSGMSLHIATTSNGEVEPAGGNWVVITNNREILSYTHVNFNRLYKPMDVEPDEGQS